MTRTLILSVLLVGLLSACSAFATHAPPEPLPAVAETQVIFAPLDSGLTQCMEAPSLADAMGQIEAVKAVPDAQMTKDQKASLVVGIQGAVLYRYDHALADCQGKMVKIREVQNGPPPASAGEPTVLGSLGPPPY